jgi:formylglycine-generating enzyme required for sulfatase activity/flavodoxin
MPDYLFFRVPFAFLDYDKAGWLIFLENLVMLLFWVLIGTQTAHCLRNAAQKKTPEKNPLLPVVYMMAAVIIGIVLQLAFPSGDDAGSFGTADWGAPEGKEAESPADTLNDSKTADQPEITEKNDGFVLIKGGSFLMGSPDTENWRIDDETQHEVTVSSFYIDPYETTQADYTRLMKADPSAFTGDDLPVETISWLDAVRYANAKSADAGFTPVYTITGESVAWDRSADGYRLPTEAEWEYACRAGTITPFNTERSLSAAEANFYGHYPYEIEENYFNDFVLEAKPGEYRQTTVAVGSFTPNAWGLYDMHGNVNEWCWDYYGAYDSADTADPTGAASGTRHVYRGGGWNDFAKNMRSAYRAAGQEDMKSFNLGVRLVRNAGSSLSGTVTAGEQLLHTETGGKILIAYFSWSGNTRGIAEEIRSQTGADLFEISPVHPYSYDYNTVLMEAQEDQHKQARPELSGHVQNMEEYDIILLGYPNWWASIPMPIASFLEEYDFSGKTIIPFCSHGGGRFGQSLTAIAKLAPESVIGEGLSVHYSGGSSLASDVTAWLTVNGLSK